MKIVPFLAPMVLWLVTASFASQSLSVIKRDASQEVWNRESFRFVWNYEKPAGEGNIYRHKILRENIISFVNELAGLLPTGKAPRIEIEAGRALSFSIDKVRGEMKLGIDYGFDLNAAVERVRLAMGVAKKESEEKDYFGYPLKYRAGYILSFRRNGKFYLAYESGGKSSLLIEENNYFDSLKLFGSSLISYRMPDSLWFLDIRRKRNFRYFPPPGKNVSDYGEGIFLNAFDSDGKNVVVVVLEKDVSHILLGPVKGIPEYFFVKLPYRINDVFLEGDKIFFIAHADADKGKTIVAAASIKDKNIFQLHSFPGKVLPLCKYKGGLILFLPDSRKMEYIDEERLVHLPVKLKVKKISDEDGTKYLIAAKEDKLAVDIKETLLLKPSRNILFLEDVNELNFVYKNAASKDYYSFCPISSNEYILLEIKGHTRQFVSYGIEGLLLGKKLLLQKQNVGRKISIAVSLFFIAALVILQVNRPSCGQGVKNAEKKQKTV
ncbi:MAG: hypothetical protein COT16_00625 [Elusimicrobia bacterium CG08_land_8_20_14_0_20_44_26]|nr:MAG: hypothetical protein COT16_00625 [Elusimicrobia bacterium CG08_land_8_20_14_0_20_44_26]